MDIPTMTNTNHQNSLHLAYSVTVGCLVENYQHYLLLKYDDILVNTNITSPK